MACDNQGVDEVLISRLGRVPYDEARAIALQMERLITDIGQYGTMIE